jgi:hypothetical protein
MSRPFTAAALSLSFVVFVVAIAVPLWACPIVVVVAFFVVAPIVERMFGDDR